MYIYICIHIYIHICMFAKSMYREREMHHERETDKAIANSK